MNEVTSHRLRFGAGIALALLVGVGICTYLLRDALAQQWRIREERRAVVSTCALTEIVSKLGGAGDGARRAVAEWQKANPSLSTIRVVLFMGLSLEASTSPADAGDKAAPRRLSRDEKPIYDRGQRLRAAIETNREEGGARKDEIEIAALPSGGLSIAAPLETDGNVTGLVEIETAPPSQLAPRPNPAAAIGLLVVPILVFLMAARTVGERRNALAILAAVLVVLSLAAYGWHSIRSLASERRMIESDVASQIKADAARGGELLGSLLPGTTLAPGSWDADTYRRPRGLISGDGRIDESKLAVELAGAAVRIKKAVALIGVLALGILAFFGFGVASAFGRSVVTYRQAYYYTLPAMLGMIVLVFFPFIYGITLSFTTYDIYTTNKPLTEIWVGLKNYVDILGDFSIAKPTAEGGWVFNYENFYWTFFVTVAWTVSNLTIGVSLGLILALILNTKGLMLRPVYRVLLIFPWAMPNYITALIWKGMFHQQFGVVNQLIQMFGGHPVSWFESPTTSFLTALATNGWLSFPFMMVVSLGALQSIPGELYEAARVDGATRWQQFLAITLPSLRPALIPAIILSVVWTFNMFNIPYLVHGGQPGGSTEILITQAYKFAFEKYRYGYAAAYSTVIFGILLIYGTIQNRVTRATEGI
ncbi:MAG: sugar ABC transporter permease [Acidobacteriota bacterium]